MWTTPLFIDDLTMLVYNIFPFNVSGDLNHRYFWLEKKKGRYNKRCERLNRAYYQELGNRHP